MPGCLVHPHVEDALPCPGCGRPFCDRCVTEIMGQRLCADCKALAVQGVIRRKARHPLALLALLVPIAGYVLCSPAMIPLTGPAGLYLGWRVLRELEEQPHLSGRSAALAGMVIGGGTLGVWLVAVLTLAVFRMSMR